MKTWTKLQIDEKDLKVFAVMGLLTLAVYLATGSLFIALNGIISFVYTFIPARLERLRK